MAAPTESFIADLPRLLIYLHRQSAPISHVRTIDIIPTFWKDFSADFNVTQSIQELERVGIVRQLTGTELKRLAEGKRISGSFVEITGYMNASTIFCVLDLNEARTALRARLGQSQRAIDEAAEQIENQRKYPSVFRQGTDLDLAESDLCEITQKTEQELMLAAVLSSDVKGKRWIMLHTKRISNLRAEIDCLQRMLDAFESEIQQNALASNGMKLGRSAIPESVRHEVWRRDEGQCTGCGSQANLEFDHIIPVSKGGGNTARNIQLLCQYCNSKKSANI